MSASDVAVVSSPSELDLAIKELEAYIGRNSPAEKDPSQESFWTTVLSSEPRSGDSSKTPSSPQPTTESRPSDSSVEGTVAESVPSTAAEAESPDKSFSKRKREDDDDDDDDEKRQEKVLKMSPEKPRLIAVDCEGVKLSREGKVTILSIATTEKLYLFDTLELKTDSLDERLKRILEDEAVVKLMFDCRNDSDAMYHQWGVTLRGVLDLQLIHILLRRGLTSLVPIRNRTKHLNERDTTSRGKVDHLWGLSKCFANYSVDSSLAKQKKIGEGKMIGSREYWSSRPITEEMIKYCRSDTMGLFQLYRIFKKNPDFAALLEKAREVSSIYAAYYRDLPSRTFNKFEQNQYLPLKIDLFIEFGLAGTTGWKVSLCEGCRRTFDFYFVRDGKCYVCQQV